MGVAIEFRDDDRAETYHSRWPAVPRKGDIIQIEAKSYEVVKAPRWRARIERERAPDRYASLSVPEVYVAIKLV